MKEGRKERRKDKEGRKEGKNGRSIKVKSIINVNAFYHMLLNQG